MARIKLTLEIEDDDGDVRRFETVTTSTEEDKSRNVGYAMAQAVSACADFVYPAAAAMIDYGSNSREDDVGDAAVELLAAAYTYLDAIDAATDSGDWSVAPAVATRPAKPSPVPLEQGGTRHGLVALEREARSVATAPNGQKNSTLFGAARRIGRLIGAGHLDRGGAKMVLAEAARRNGFTERQLTDVLRRAIPFGMESPRTGVAVGNPVATE